MPINVSKEVWEGISFVRESGKVNMLDRPMVAKICMDMGFHEAALWVNDNRKLYSEGIFNGFEAVENPDEDEE